MTGDNVQHHDDVHLLPWAEAFAMAPLPASVATPVHTRRRADTRTLAEIVEQVNACPLVLLDVDLLRRDQP